MCVNNTPETRKNVTASVPSSGGLTESDLDVISGIGASGPAVDLNEVEVSQPPEAPTHFTDNYGAEVMAFANGLSTTGRLRLLFTKPSRQEKMLILPLD